MTKSTSKASISKPKHAATVARRRAQLFEGLESRRLFNAYNPLPVPLLTINENDTATNVIVATFASADPFVGLTATVNFPIGTATVPSVPGTIAQVGTVFVPGVGNVPQYVVAANFTAGTTSTGANQPQFSVQISDATDTTNAWAFGNIQVIDPNVTPLVPSLVVAPAPVVVTEGGLVPASTTFGTFTDSGGTEIGETYAGTATIGGTVIPLTLTQVGTGATFVLTSTADAPLSLTAGPATFSLDVTSSTGLETTVAGPLTVNPSLLTLVSINPAPAATAGSPLASFPLTVFNNVNLSYPLSSYVITIDWGDGSPTSAGTASPNTSDVLVSGDHVYRAAGTYTVNISVTDPAGQALAISVPGMTVSAAALTTDTAADFTGQRGQSLQNVFLGTFTDANPLATTADFSAAIDFGDGSGAFPGVITLIGTSAGSSVFAVYGSHAYANAGSFSITTTITDTSSNTTDIASSATITDSFAITPAPVTLTEGDTVPANTIIGTFTDPGANLGITYTAVAIVNGASVPLTVTPAILGNNTFGLLVTADTTIPGGLTVGSSVLLITVTDSDGVVGAAVGSLTVTPATLALASTTAPSSVVEGNALNSVALASFTDPNPLAVPADFTASIDWGDGTPATAGTISAVAGVFSVAGSHTYTTPATRQATITISDTTGRRRLTATTASFAVADASLSTPLPAPDLQAVAGQQVTGALVGTFVDTNPLADAPTYTASIDWGDGSSPSAGSFVRLGASSAGVIYGIYGTHTYTAPASAVITSSVTSTGGNTLLVTSSAVVADAPITATGTHLAAVAHLLSSPTVATFSDALITAPASAFDATINWGDGTSSAGTIADDGGGHYHVVGSHVYPSTVAANYPVNVTITHNGGSTATVSSIANIFAPKLIAGPSLELFAHRNKAVRVKLGSFTDQNQPNQAAKIYLTRTSVIYWGDGTSTKLTAADFKRAGADATVGGFWKVFGSHRYAANGVKDGKIVINSKYGQHVTLKFKVNVGNVQPV